MFNSIENPILLRVGKDINQDDLINNPELLNAVLQGKVRLQGGIPSKKKLKKKITSRNMLSTASQIGASALGSGLGWHFGEKLKMFKKMPAVGGSMLAVPAGILAANLAKGMSEE